MSARPPELNRRLAAFWFADIVGFTSLSARDEHAALVALDGLRRHATEEIERAGGTLIKVSGDAVLAEFGGCDAALKSAIALRDALAGSVELHIGVHLGEVSYDHGDIYGDGVNTAARLQAHAKAGQVLASEDVFRHVRANPAFDFEPVGSLELKGLPAPLKAYCVELSGGPRVARVAEAQPAPTPPPETKQATRLIVAPFRMLRPDEDTSFLAYSLADAVSFSLSNIQSIVVRLSHMAGGSADAPVVDPREVARKTDVDLVVTGTLLRVGDRVQVTAELSDGRDGTRLSSFRSQAGMGDLFDLQEAMTERIVEALALPLTARERSLLQHDVPASPRAYELYLRANQLSYRMSDWNEPREFYLAALSEDPTYAPAWAHLGRCHRLIAKFGARELRPYRFAQAEAALKKALELNLDLDLAHGYAAQLETDLGRGGEAMIRLLERLVARPGGVDLLASLVHVLRYCGLLEESIAVDAEVRTIDPSARTSVIYTHFVRGDFERVLSMASGIDVFVGSMANLALGRNAEALELAEAALRTAGPLLASFVGPIKLIIEGDREGAVREGRSLYRDFPDPEGRFIFARELAWAGYGDEALDFLDRIAPEFAALPDPGVDPWLASIDRTERYAGLLSDVHQRRDRFRDQYRALRMQSATAS